jgi:nitrogen regulatory protein P-II 1
MAAIESITCIVQRGKSSRVVKAAMEAGAQGATVFYARGTGIREKLGPLGAFILPEKEVIIIVTPAEKTRAIFDQVVDAGRLDEPGQGFAYIQKIERAIGFLEA